MGDFGADTLRDSLFTGWALTGRLLKEGSETGTMKETVHFFAHPQMLGHEYTKAVQVQKINTPESEGLVNHTTFIEVTDVFEVRCRYRLDGTDEALYDQAEGDIEDMTEEVLRIIKTVYDPTTTLGTFMTTNYQWSNEDNINQEAPELIRLLRLTLTQIKSKSAFVFRGYGGTLVFDNANSIADSKPGTNYTYTEATDVRCSEGWETIPYLTNDTALGEGVPFLARGMFRGTFECKINAKKQDLDGSTFENLQQMYKLQTSGQHGTAVFLEAAPDTEGSPATFTCTRTVKITSIEMINNDEDLIKLAIRGQMVKPSTYAVS